MKNLEGHIKASLENFEVPYNPADWEDMDKRLNNLSSDRGKSSVGIGLMIAASFIAFAGLIYYFNAADSGKNVKEEKKIAQIQSHNAVQPEENSGIVESGESHESGTQQEASDNTSTEKTILNENKTENRSTVLENTENASDTKENTITVEKQSQPSSPDPLSSMAAVLNASFHFNQTIVCAGTEIKFTTDNTPAACTYRWDFGDGKTSAEKSPSHSYKNAGTYNVKLKLTETKQKVSDEKQVTLVVNPVPSVEIDYSITDYNPSEINFGASIPSGEAKGNNISEYIWDFDDKQTSSEKNPVHNYMKKGNYQVTVTAKNSFGCSSSDKRMVNVRDLFPLAPGLFSPNGDNLNDTWMPASFKNGNHNFTLTVYDKHGVVAFKTSDKNESWDGGNAIVGDVFIWKATVQNKNGKETNYNGSITIVGKE